jgi:hypothetical protein
MDRPSFLQPFPDTAAGVGYLYTIDIMPGRKQAAYQSSGHISAAYECNSHGWSF